MPPINLPQSTVSGGDPNKMVKIRNSQTGQTMQIPETSVPYYTGGSAAPTTPPTSGSTAGLNPVQANITKLGQGVTSGAQGIEQTNIDLNKAKLTPPNLTGDETFDRQTWTNYYNSLPIGAERDQVASSYKLAYGKDIVAPTKVQEKEAEYKQNIDNAYNLAKDQVQSIINAFNLVPSDQRGITSAKAAASRVPGAGYLFGQALAPQGVEYEKGRQGLAAQLAPLSGGGAGTGLRISQSELNAWSTMLPSIHKSDDANKYDVARLHLMMTGKFGQGLDQKYLDQYGIDSKYLQGVDPNKPFGESTPSVGGFIQNAGQDIAGMVGGIGKLGELAVNENPASIAARTGAALTSGQDPTQPIKEFAQTEMNLGRGIVSDLGATTGTSIGPDGKVKIDPGAALQHAYQHPVDTATWLAPLLKVGKLGTLAKAADEAGTVGKTAEAATVAEKGSVFNRAGTAIRGDVSKIREPASIYGAAREQQIQQTLDNLGVNGSAQQKYEQLAPKVEQLSNDIEKELTTNPKTIELTGNNGLYQQFENNLRDQFRTDPLESKNVSKQISGYFNDLRSSKPAPGKAYPTTTTNEELFNLKKKMNADYQRIAKKRASGSPLTDTEKVAYAARKTVDDAITEANPLIKEKTLQQSNLYDAADSLESARRAEKALSIFKIPLPVPGELVARGKDLTGRALQGSKNPISGASATLKKGIKRSAVTTKYGTRFGLLGQDYSNQTSQ